MIIASWMPPEDVNHFDMPIIVSGVSRSGYNAVSDELHHSDSYIMQDVEHDDGFFSLQH